MKPQQRLVVKPRDLDEFLSSWSPQYILKFLCLPEVIFITHLVRLMGILSARSQAVFPKGFYGSLWLTLVSSSYLVISKSTCVCQIWHSSQSLGSVINVSTCVLLQEQILTELLKNNNFPKKIRTLRVSNFWSDTVGREKLMFQF